MSERILNLRKINPDLLVSIHCNAGGSPFTGKGTSTYYRHTGFRPLSTAILKRLLELDVNNFGNIGSFNFALNSPTEYPNVLVETLFLSSPEDEAKILDENFQNNMIDKIMQGLQDFLNEQKNTN
jgi:N-acetylmuramoyl-L-alanine amidase